MNHLFIRDWLKMYFSCHDLENKVVICCNHWGEIENSVQSHIFDDNELSDKVFFQDFIYQIGIQLFPKSSELFGNYANLFFCQKYFERAKEYYQKAIELDPKNKRVQLNYIHFLKYQLFKKGDKSIDIEKMRDHLQSLSEKGEEIFLFKKIIHHMDFCYLTKDFDTLKVLKQKLFDTNNFFEYEHRLVELLYETGNFDVLHHYSFQISQKSTIENIHSRYMDGWFYSQEKTFDKDLAHKKFLSLENVEIPKKHIYLILKFYFKIKDKINFEKWINHFLSYSNNFSIKIIRLLKDYFREENKKFQEYLKIILDRETDLRKIQKFKKEFSF